MTSRRSREQVTPSSTAPRLEAYGGPPTIRPFDPSDVRAVTALWNRSIGDRYPLTPNTLETLVLANPSHRRGDALVVDAAASNRIVAFAYATTERGTEPELGAYHEATHLQAVVVDTAHRRRGLGRALVRAITQDADREGRRWIEAGSGFFYAWPGIPLDLEHAEPFVAALGLRPGSISYDLRGDVAGIRVGPPERAALASAGLFLDSARPADREALLAYLFAEFGGEWWHDVRFWLDNGLAPERFVVLRDGDGLIRGHARIHLRDDRPVGPPLFWAARRGASAGGLGPIGVARDLRGRGVGRALLVGALEMLTRAGATDVVIDFTTLLGFYGPLGFAPWMTFRHARARVGDVLAATLR